MVDMQHHLNYHSAMTITIDRAGRVVLPKSVRERFHLVPGAELELTAEADGVKLAVRATQPALVTRRGVLIHHGPAPVALDIAAFINKTRESRSIDAAEG
jgi:AbrB family looped-hinge helix DNA binding protein